jgi:hypothetical protein
MRLLLRAGAKPAGAGVLASRSEGATDNGRTALMLAANSGHTEAVRLLLEAGAPFRDVDRNGCSSVELARMAGHDHVVKLLEEYAAAHPYVAPSGWKKVRGLRNATAATSAFGAPKKGEAIKFSHVLSGRADLGVPGMPARAVPSSARSLVVRRPTSHMCASQARRCYRGRTTSERACNAASQGQGEASRAVNAVVQRRLVVCWTEWAPGRSE